MQRWQERVETYVGQLHETVESIDRIVQQIGVTAESADPDSTEPAATRLSEALVALESKVAERQTLLDDQLAPAEGLTLIAKLRGTGVDADSRLADRCEQIAERVETVYQRCISLFVCQFHLSQLTGELVGLLTGNDTPATYQVSNSVTAGRGASPHSQGGLLNETA